MQLITTKPTIYLVNLTMKDYLRQKSKYLPLIAKWVTEHGGLPRDIIPFSIEFEEKVYSFKDDKEGLEEWLKENGGGKVRSRLEKIVTEGFTKLGLQYYFTGELFSSLLIFKGKTNIWMRLMLCSWRKGNSLLDYPTGVSCSTGGRCYSWRFRAWLH